MAKRQEQESAREEVTEVAPGVLRMQLPIMMPGLGHVNCYALIDEEGAAVVDPGLPTPGSFKALQQRLAQADLAVKDIHTVLVTHSHPDHFGGAMRIIKESGARMVAHSSFQLGFAKPEKPEVSVADLHAHEHDCAQQAGTEGDESDDASLSSESRRVRGELNMRRQPFVPEVNWGAGLTPWGGERPRPSLRMRMRMGVRRMISKGLSFPMITHPVIEGDVLELAGREFFVIHTPGHTEDHFCLHDPEAGIFLAGDHVLPTITPHISGLSHNRDPLASFFESLDRAAAIPDIENVLPAHGHPFDNLAARCEAIKIHHDERLAKVRAIARDIGPANVEAFTRRLFKRRSWGAMADSETYAHLEHIRLLGDADVHRDREGKLIYVL
jgi:glyoxylase-like metal-dependent hydrolase (beta-lactamase superfamily II)